MPAENEQAAINTIAADQGDGAEGSADAEELGWELDAATKARAAKG